MDAQTFSTLDPVEANERLKEISRMLYGDTAELRIVNPKDLVILKKNARYFDKQVFDRLVENLRGDGKLSSTPLCHIVEDEKLEVLSGNHRVKAAAAAGLEKILIIVLLEKLDEGHKIAVQLSHNALVGKDDRLILAELWQQMDDLEDRLYSGLDSKEMDELLGIQFAGFGAAQVPTETISLLFLPEEVQQMDDLLNDVKTWSAKHIYLAPIGSYEKIFKLLVEIKKTKDIKNTSLAFWQIIEMAEQKFRELQAQEETIEQDVGEV